ncbi:hypothetical protein EUGRSUZ_K00652 [Eucalyptus grandis]|uniref:Uncharacterized protein n=2 Tax=Eucalyptus grandis TaxID=71139 RepID=A0ACC3IR73_EUCGR|nr:hypothetical protein EUGRSUZ_K00652 [Eucalyptus grandis]
MFNCTSHRSNHSIHGKRSLRMLLGLFSSPNLIDTATANQLYQTLLKISALRGLLQPKLAHRSNHQYYDECNTIIELNPIPDVNNHTQRRDGT